MNTNPDAPLLQAGACLLCGLENIKVGHLCGIARCPMRQDDLGRLQADLDETIAEIEAAYWRFSRTSSPKVSPPPAYLYVRKRELEEQIRALGAKPVGRFG